MNVKVGVDEHALFLLVMVCGDGGVFGVVEVEGCGEFEDAGDEEDDGGVDEEVDAPADGPGDLHRGAWGLRQHSGVRPLEGCVGHGVERGLDGRAYLRDGRGDKGCELSDH